MNECLTIVDTSQCPGECMVSDCPDNETFRELIESVQWLSLSSFGVVFIIRDKGASGPQLSYFFITPEAWL